MTWHNRFSERESPSLIRHTVMAHILDTCLRWLTQVYFQNWNLTNFESNCIVSTIIQPFLVSQVVCLCENRNWGIGSISDYGDINTDERMERIACLVFVVQQG